MSAQPIRAAEAQVAPTGTGSLSARTVGTSPTGLYAKLYNVMCEVGYIQKDAKNKDQDYSYLSDVAIKERLQALFIKHKLLFIQRSATVTDCKTGLGKYGNQIIFVARLAYTFVDVETGETLDGECDGAGPDWLDKGLNKAITSASKYALRNTFMIPTGDDPEKDVEDKRSKAEEKTAAKAEQKQVLERKLAEIKQGVTQQLAPDEQVLLDNVGMVRPKINELLTKQSFELAELLGGNKAGEVTSKLLEKFGSPNTKSLHIPQLRELAVLLHRELQKAQGENVA